MPHTDDHTDWEQIIRDMIARSSESAPTEPGVYRMPCGNCYVDFFRTSDGTESWLVPGDERSYTRDTVAIDRHGDHPWERMYTLGHAAAEIRRRATADDTPVEVLVEQLAAIAAVEDAAEAEEAGQLQQGQDAQRDLLRVDEGLLKMKMKIKMKKR